MNPGNSAADNKAKVFESASGFAKETADNLVIEDKQGVMNHTPVPGKADQFGVRFAADISVTGPAESGAGVLAGYANQVLSLIFSYKN